MSPAAKSIFAFSIYLLGIGLILTIVPNILLQLFLFPPTTEVWVRVVGLLAFLLGFYYFMAARAELTTFFAWTVPTRVCVFVVFGLFALLKMSPPALALFGLIDLIGASCTAWALRTRAAPTPAAVR